LKLEEFGVSGSDAENVCYLRDLTDANGVFNVMQSCAGGNAVVIGIWSVLHLWLSIK